MEVSEALEVSAINPDESIKPVGEFILIKQTTTKKKSLIITSVSKNERDKFDYDFKVLKLGSKCTSDVKVGDTPIFSEYVKFNIARMIEKNEDGMTCLALVHENDIIGIDTDPSFKM